MASYLCSHSPASNAATPSTSSHTPSQTPSQPSITQTLPSPPITYMTEVTICNLISLTFQLTGGSATIASKTNSYNSSGNSTTTGSGSGGGGYNSNTTISPSVSQAAQVNIGAHTGCIWVYRGVYGCIWVYTGVYRGVYRGI